MTKSKLKTIYKKLNVCKNVCEYNCNIAAVVDDDDVDELLFFFLLLFERAQAKVQFVVISRVC